MRDVLIVAAEASADVHGAAFVRELRTRRPDARIWGIGGAELAAAGVELIERAESLAVMGFAEVVAHIPKHWSLLRRIRTQLKSGTVGLVVLLDYPGFNMKVAEAAAAAGVPVLYYIVPQVWAWGAGRLRELSRTVTKAACILPFEEPLLRQHGIDATFVGHPLLDRLASMPAREEARARFGVPNDAPLLAIFPGSRTQEVRRHLEPAIATAQRLSATHPGLRVLVSAAATVELRDDEIPYPVVRSASLAVLRAADAALCKSGTTTLEAAAAGCPLIVVYKTSPLTFALAQRMVRIPNIGLVNVVAGKVVAPEFVQDAFTPEAAAAALTPLLDRASPARAKMVEELADVRKALGEPGAAARVATIAAAMLA